MKKKQRLFLLLTLTLLAFATIFIIVNEFNKNIVFFYTPSTLDYSSTKTIRVGGIVKLGSFRKIENGKYEFIVSDNNKEINIVYKGILPDLFRENQGIIATGKIINNIFIAEEVLAKHDENYMPREVYESMRNNLQ